MTGWIEVPIGDVMAGFFDGPHATPKPSGEGPIYLGIKNITEDGHLDLTQVRHISWEDFPRWIRRVEPKHGDLVFTYEASLHRYAIVPPGFKGCLGRRTALIRPDTSVVDGRFLLYQFLGPRWRSEVTRRINIGSTVDRIPLIDFPKFPIRLPPLPVQKKIAAVLAAYDELIENNLRRIEILEEMAHAVYREWFVNFRFPGHEDVPLVDSPLGPIPEGWGVAAIKDICSRIQAGSTPLRSNPSFWDEKGVDWYKTGELHDGFLLGSEEHVSPEAPIRMFDPGTILMAIYGSPTVGRMGIVVQPSSANQAALGLVPDPKRLGTILLFHILLDRRAHFNAIAQGAAQQNISKTKVESTKVVLPRREVVSKFEELIQPHWDLQLNLALQNANLRATRDLLLPKLVSGEIDVSDLDIDTEWLAS